MTSTETMTKRKHCYFCCDVYLELEEQDDCAVCGQTLQSITGDGGSAGIKPGGGTGCIEANGG